MYTHFFSFIETNENFLPHTVKAKSWVPNYIIVYIKDTIFQIVQFLFLNCEPTSFVGFTHFQTELNNVLN